MPFLPCFHIIVTLTSSGSKLEDPDISSISTNEKALFQLHSYHGKVLADESIPLSLCEKSADYNLISQMADDRFRMCRGIEDISGVKFAQFVNLPFFYSQPTRNFTQPWHIDKGTKEA